MDVSQQQVEELTSLKKIAEKQMEQALEALQVKTEMQYSPLHFW